MRAVIVGDVHLSDRPPSVRTDEYASDILKKIEWVVVAANGLALDALVFAGDVFHIKTPSRTSHDLVSKTADLLARATMPVRIVPGNHDMQHDRLDSLDSQPLGVLGRMPNVNLLVGWDDKLPLFGIPYLWDWKKELPPYMNQWRQRVKDTWDGELLVTHAPIVQPGKTLPYEYIDADDWALSMGTGACYFGHMHDLDGTFLSSDASVEFCNQGALSRGSLHESSLRRKPAVTVFDGEVGLNEETAFKRIEVPHRPVEEVFRLTVKKIEDEKAQTLDEFLESIADTKLEVLSVESVLEHARSLDLKSGTIAQIESCLEHALTGD